MTRGRAEHPPLPLANAVLHEDVAAVAEEMEAVLRPLRGTRLLVAGGGGFLCSYFLDTVAYLNDHAWDQPCHMVCLDHSQPGPRIAHLLERPDVQYVRHDISRPWWPDDAPDWIIHGASIASPPVYRQYPLETIDVNVGGARNLLNLARERGARGMLYLSSSEVYGDPDPGAIPTPEEHRGSVSCTGPRACYDESKRLAETLCTVYHRQSQTPVSIVRPFNVYGPGQRLDDGRILPDLMGAALRREPLVLFSDGRATRAFCYVTDAVRAMWHVLLAGSRGEVFNVGNDQEEIAIRDLAERVREVAGPPWLDVVHQTSGDPDYLSDNPQRRCPSLARLRSAFPWQPRVSLAEGLRRTLESYRLDTLGRVEPGRAPA